MIVQNLIAIAILIVFAIYFNHSANITNEVYDMVILDNVTLKQAILSLTTPKKIMLLVGLPIIVPLAIIMYLFNWILYHNMFK